MDESEYERVGQIIGYVLRQPHLTAEDREDIRQEAAIAAWKFGIMPSTRVYGTALTMARKIRDKRIFEPIDFDVAQCQHIEESVIAEDLLNHLTERERIALQGTIEGYSQREVGELIGRDDSVICRYRKSAIEKLRKQV